MISNVPHLPEPPVLEWRDGAMRSSDGRVATAAQDAKARRYLNGKIRRVSSDIQTTGFGGPWRIEERYEIDPIPGTKQVRRVRVVEYHDGNDVLRGVNYWCDCQRAGGTVATKPTACSHAYAVHLHRTGAN